MDEKLNEVLWKIKAYSEQIDISLKYQHFVVDMISIALDRPELTLKPSSDPGYNLFAVIKINDVPTLVVSGANRYYFSSEGTLREFRPKTFPIASDEEIESYLDNLSSRQLQALLSNEYTAPLFVSLFEEQTELVPESAMSADDIAF